MHEPQLPPLPPQTAFSEVAAPPDWAVSPAPAPPPVPVTMASVASDVWDFVRDPRPTLPRVSRPLAVLWRVVGLYAIAMIMAGSVAALGAKVSGSTNVLEDARTKLNTPEGRATLLFLAGVAAPVLEETAFRLMLAPFAAPRVFLSLLGLGLFAATQVPHPAKIPVLALLVLALCAVAATWAAPTWREQVRDWWQKSFAWIVALSVLSFGFAHAGNYKMSASGLGALAVVPLLVLPQLAAGVLLSYVRVKLGFRYAVLLHGAVNSVLVVALFAAPEEPPKKPTPKTPASALRTPAPR